MRQTIRAIHSVEFIYLLIPKAWCLGLSQRKITGKTAAIQPFQPNARRDEEDQERLQRHQDGDQHPRYRFGHPEEQNLRQEGQEGEDGEETDRAGGNPGRSGLGVNGIEGRDDRRKPHRVERDRERILGAGKAEFCDGRLQPEAGADEQNGRLPKKVFTEINSRKIIQKNLFVKMCFIILTTKVLLKNLINDYRWILFYLHAY